MRSYMEWTAPGTQSALTETTDHFTAVKADKDSKFRNIKVIEKTLRYKSC